MALLKLRDFDPNYREALDNKDIHGFSVYAEGTNEKIGSVDELLVDEEGNFRYLVVDLGFWIFGKKVLLPIGRTRINFQEQRIYALGMSKEQAENLPEFSENMTVDYEYEERVRGVYRPQVTHFLDSSTPANTSVPLDAPSSTTVSNPSVLRPNVDQNNASSYTRESYSYQQEPSLYGLSEQDHQNLRLYEERLIASKRRQKTGEVVVGKHVETETARVSVPVERERVVIERNTPTDAGSVVTPDKVNFQSGEVARMEVYEETADIHKEAFVREQISVRKEVDRDTVEAEETIRREELDIDTQGRVVEDRTGKGFNDRT
jgi:uncharacterized protein (TIGR02271 family)